MSIHDGHRQRLKERFENEGLDHFSAHQVLEFLLFFCIPRKDTNPVAHRLLEQFGTLSRVLEAPVSELKNVEGIGDNAALFIHFLNEFCRYHQVDRAGNLTVLKTVGDCGRYLVPRFYNRKNEIVLLLCLDAKCKVLCCKEIGEGSVNSAAIPVRRVVEVALHSNATSVVLAHNHPSGLALPSEEDIFTTKRVAAALNAVEIELVDHIVVADDDFVSMAQSGMYVPQHI